MAAISPASYLPLAGGGLTQEIDGGDPAGAVPSFLSSPDWAALLFAFGDPAGEEDPALRLALSVGRCGEADAAGALCCAR
jgi:hypothetical protein